MNLANLEKSPNFYSPKLSRLSRSIRPCTSKYRLWPVQRCSLSIISKKPATYLIHRDLKPSMGVQWTRESSHKWTATANKSERFLILWAHFSLSLSNGGCLDILVLVVATHHCIHAKVAIFPVGDFIHVHTVSEWMWAFTSWHSFSKILITNIALRPINQIFANVCHHTGDDMLWYSISCFPRDGRHLALDVRVDLFHGQSVEFQVPWTLAPLPPLATSQFVELSVWELEPLKATC